MKNQIPNAIEAITVHCKKKRIYKAALARKMNVNYKLVITSLKTKNISFDKLVRFCHGLEHNFLLDLAHQIPSTYTNNLTANDTKEDEKATLKAHILVLETENKLLKEIITNKIDI